MLPNDPYILFSYINTKLRDTYTSLEELCKSENSDINVICERLEAIGMHYSSEKNSFVKDI